ncbi:MAG: bifunctional hydroxymethylpyrimidine kinase/phosphomethylpyrimidine kinase [Desulfobacterales bacterium]
MERPPRTYRRVLTIAGSDSGGGAGIQADLKTIAALGCYGASAITALTAQNTTGVRAIHPVPAEFTTAQIDAVLEDIGADAVKIGMLYSSELIRAVAQALRRWGARNVVLDPVMVAQSGDRLLREEAVAALKDELIPLADVITPNLPEAEVLLGGPVRDREAMAAAAFALGRLGSRAVLLKGGHLEGPESADLLYLGAAKRTVVFSSPRIPTANTHGTGCTLSSAIAAGLAKGRDIEQAVREAKGYLDQALRAGAGYTLGRGHGPVHHFHRFWE